MSDLRLRVDKAAHRLMWALTVLCSVLVVLMGVGLYLRSRPILASHSLSSLLFSAGWHPLKGEFGFWPFIAGTFWVTGVAVAIAVPFSLLTAIYLSEYAGRWMRDFMKPVIDLLAGIPSVVYGVWGMVVIVPFVKDVVAPRFGTFSSGYSVLAGGIVLAVMILPVIINVSVEVLATVPVELRQASLALGATRWQTVKHVVLRKALPGVLAANVLGFSRAFGETMAVLMVCGNVALIPKSVLDPAYPLPALIANNYGEMLSIPMYDAALLLAALILFVLVMIFSVLSRVVLLEISRKVE